jgi:hypothetical protein
MILPFSFPEIGLLKTLRFACEPPGHRKMEVRTGCGRRTSEHCPPAQPV